MRWMFISRVLKSFEKVENKRSKKSREKVAENVN